MGMGTTMRTKCRRRGVRVSGHRERLLRCVTKCAMTMSMKTTRTITTTTCPCAGRQRPARCARPPVPSFVRPMVEMVSGRAHAEPLLRPAATGIGPRGMATTTAATHWRKKRRPITVRARARLPVRPRRVRASASVPRGTVTSRMTRRRRMTWMSTRAMRTTARLIPSPRRAGLARRHRWQRRGATRGSRNGRGGEVDRVEKVAMGGEVLCLR
ncbi:hypothetical protein AMAG_18618 [Allomyces macrogynus ATCC 38327]|uniref:Uncharacterized protein n=1 Tax=Allomyces macrogynus (strain ATCC 38327) TaxID=578462 RepID=A0A0L0SG00_ALLM3|nr:hypothetical protein AMAG_18618 [Allomyces macrogynus ATCC 38327]|eukprot:KNE61377.1 hypothetical protein AMAG_18618 [Allomyces macrogynus ATCC 38327]